MTEEIAVRCPAKLNLLLRVLAREVDGYHGLETVFLRINLADDLLVTRAESGIELKVTGADLGPMRENLAWRAAEAVLAATGMPFGVKLQLQKKIPAGAGLGGGSSDAAATLLAVNQLAGNAIPRGELFNMAHRLGADVPFFMAECPLALAWGHGQRLLRLPPPPDKPILLLLPDFHIKTSDAFGWLDRIQENQTQRGAIALDGKVLSSWGDLARISGNDFESAVFGRHPKIRDAYQALASTNPMICRMSGSGSALFAVYRSARDREDAAAMLGTGFGMLVKAEAQ